MKQLAWRTPSQRLLAHVLAADWSPAAVRTWPAAELAGVDWAEFAELAVRHKVRPMAAVVLREAGHPPLPAALTRAFNEAEADWVGRSMRQCLLLAEIQRAAARHGLRVIVLKGVALSARLYGDPFIREAFDVDLLVHPHDAAAAARVLTSLGFSSLDGGPRLTDRQEAILARYHHDRRFAHAASGVVVELHHALDRNHGLIATNFDRLWAGRAVVTFAGGDVAVLGTDDLVRYLCIHASRHAWERLKWLGDLAALYQRMTAGELQALMDLAAQSGAGHVFASSLLLVARLTPAALPPPVLAAAAADAKARRLADMATRLALTKLDHLWIVRWTAYRLFIARDFAALAFEAAALFHREEDWRRWRLPDALIPLYYLMRPVTYIGRRLGVLAQPAQHQPGQRPASEATQ